MSESGFASPLSGPDHLGDARLHIAVTAYNDARDALVRHARAAISGGCESAMVRIAQDQADLVVTAVHGALRQLGIDPEQHDVRKALRAGLEAAAVSAGTWSMRCSWTMEVTGDPDAR